VRHGQLDPELGSPDVEGCYAREEQWVEGATETGVLAAKRRRRAALELRGQVLRKKPQVFQVFTRSANANAVAER